MNDSESLEKDSFLTFVQSDINIGTNEQNGARMPSSVEKASCRDSAVLVTCC
jgi:hypothetical protein